MLVQVLGEVSLLAADGDTVPLPGTRQPALLAALAARAGEIVSADRLVDLLWGETPPVNPTSTLHSTVFKLRASLAGVSGREVLVTRERGYLLDLRPGDLDAQVFAALVDGARDRAPDEAAGALDRALRLWRGTAYGQFADTEVAYLEALRLEELRREAVERRGAALLAAGRPGEAVSLLQPFVSDRPLREAARITLMQALHAVGRTPEALEHYQTHRKHLAEELGLEPSHSLRQAQVALLRPVRPAGRPVGATGPGGGRGRGASSGPGVPAAEADAPADGVGVPAQRAGQRTGEPAAVAGRTGLPGMAVRYLRTPSGSVLAHGTTGTGPKVVVLLGWVSSLDVLASGRDPRSSLLERLTGDVQLTLFDRAGSGLSPGPVADYGLEAGVAELAAVVDEVGPPVSLLSMSSSGPIALTLAHRHPEWVDSLALFGTFANGPATFRDDRMYAMVVEIARSHWGVGSKMLADLYRPGLSDEAAWEMARMFRDSASAEVAAAYLEAFRPQDVTDLLPQIATPALVLHYRRDRLIWFGGGQQLAAGLPNATFLPLDGRFHLPDAADLDTIERAIVSHVRRHARVG